MNVYGVIITAAHDEFKGMRGQCWLIFGECLTKKKQKAKGNGKVIFISS